jgi:hypothetical protein
MNTKRLLFGTIVLLAVLATSAFSWVTGSNIFAAQRALTFEVGSLNAADLAAYRWSTLDQQILLRATSTGDLRALSAADISAYRWTSMAKFYASQAQKAADLSAYRWEAMAKFYASRSQSLDAADSAPYRWSARDAAHLFKATSGSSFARLQGSPLFTPPGH